MIATDQQKTCIDCQAPYTFTKGEQEFFTSKKLTPPLRCPDCRKARKAARLNKIFGERKKPSDDFLDNVQ